MVQIRWVNDRENRVWYGFVEETNYIFYIDNCIDEAHHRMYRRLLLYQDIHNDKHPVQVCKMGMFLQIGKAKKYAEDYLEDHMAEIIKYGVPKQEVKDDGGGQDSVSEAD